MKVYKIYLIKNLINGKVYIGQTMRSVSTRFKEHQKEDSRLLYKRPLQLAIKKYGVENFSIEILVKCNDEKRAIDLESFYIKKYNSADRKFGYNLVIESISGRDFTEDSIKKMRLRRIESYNSFSEEKKNLIKEKLSYHFQGKRKNEKTGFIGVFRTKNGTFNIRSKRWKNIKRQSFKSPIKAAIAYDKIILFLYGEDRKFNFPQKINKWKKQNLKKFFDMLCIKRIFSKRKKFIYFSKKRMVWVVSFFKNEGGRKKKIKSKIFKTECEAKLWRDENFYKYLS